jgi:hypothetical protein
VKAGVPYMSAYGLWGLTKKAKSQGKTISQTEAVLSFVHPILMENIRVTSRKLTLRNRKYTWLRRSGWAEKC